MSTTHHSFILPGDDPAFPTVLPVEDGCALKIVHRSGITFMYSRSDDGKRFDTVFQRPSTKAEKLELIQRTRMIPK